MSDSWDERKVEGAFLTSSKLEEQAHEMDVKIAHLKEKRAIKYAELLASAEGSVELRKAIALAGVAELDTEIYVCDAVQKTLRKQTGLFSDFISAWQTHARLTT